MRRGYPVEPFPGIAAVVAGLAALPGFFTAVVIIGGVVSGIFTVTESAAVGVIHALLVTMFVYRSLTVREFWQSVVYSIRTTAMVMVLIGTATLFAYFLALYQFPASILNLPLGISENPIVLLLLINLSLLVLGAVMDMSALILIFTPIFLPVVTAIGMDPVQFGILLMMNLGLGLTTPPVGACLFVGRAIAKVCVERVNRTICSRHAAFRMRLPLGSREQVSRRSERLHRVMAAPARWDAAREATRPTLRGRRQRRSEPRSCVDPVGDRSREGGTGRRLSHLRSLRRGFLKPPFTGMMRTDQV